jgi:flagellar biosynthesis/type III secretory pathway protein FliH
MYERLLEEDPKIQKYLADKREEQMRLGLRQGLEQGFELGRTQGEILASQRMVVQYVQLRFPTIAPLAQQKVTQIKRVDDLDKLFRLTINAPDEATARWVLDNYAA